MPNIPQHTVPTPQQLAELAAFAEAVAHRAYAPYSRFLVGAALLLETGEVVVGANVENASYRLTTCAEQAAIATGVALHGPAIRLRAVVVHNLNRTSCQPCGACLQTIAEFAPSSAIITYPAVDGVPRTCTLADLLPSIFSLHPHSPTI